MLYFCHLYICSTIFEYMGARLMFMLKYNCFIPIVRAILPIRVILIREYSYHTHTWNDSKYDWNPFIYIYIYVYIYYFLCRKGDIIYRYVSLHLEFWDFLILVNLGRSIIWDASCQIGCLQCVKCMHLPLLGGG